MIPIRMKLYIDYWNFQRNAWNAFPDERVRLRWPDLGAEALRVARTFNTEWSGMTCKGTEIFASRPPNGAKLSDKAADHLAFLEGMRDMGVKVRIASRKWKDASLTCKRCGTSVGSCPACETPFIVEREKGVDIDLCAAVFDDLCDGVCDGVIIASQDEDFVPMIQSLRRRGIPTVNLGFAHGGHPMAQACEVLVTLEEIYGNVCIKQGRMA